MAKEFQELIKTFETIRHYASEFYVYGFDDRDSFPAISKRTYDNERRRIESYLANYIKADFQDGRKVYRLEVDANRLDNNPFYRLWQTKSFTKNDIFMHFALLSLLETDSAFSLKELLNKIDQMILPVCQPDFLIESMTLRKKLKEYKQLGLILESKRGRELVYQLSHSLTLPPSLREGISFFSHVYPLGVIGSYLNQKYPPEDPPIAYKHLFVVQTLDDEILLSLLNAISAKREVELKFKHFQSTVLPLRIYSSCESGRQFVTCYQLKGKHLVSYRLDNIQRLKLLNQTSLEIDGPKLLHAEEQESWNASFNQGSLNKLSLTLKIQLPEENFLIQRLENEGRQGTLRQLGSDTFLYEISLKDLTGITPFVRTFIGRIVKLESTDQQWLRTFKEDYHELYHLYCPTKTKNLSGGSDD